MNPFETVSPADEALSPVSLVEVEELVDSELEPEPEPEPDPVPEPDDPVPVSEVPLDVVELVVLLLVLEVDDELLVITSDESLLLVLLLNPEVRPLPFSLANSSALFDDSPRRLTTM